MLTCIDVEFTFGTVRLGLSGSANIIEIADVALRVVFPLHFLVKHKILPNLVISNWLWWIMRVLLANQNWGNILNE